MEAGFSGYRNASTSFSLLKLRCAKTNLWGSRILGISYWENAQVFLFRVQKLNISSLFTSQTLGTNTVFSCQILAISCFIYHLRAPFSRSEGHPKSKNYLSVTNLTKSETSVFTVKTATVKSTLRTCSKINPHVVRFLMGFYGYFNHKKVENYFDQNLSQLL